MMPSLLNKQSSINDFLTAVDPVPTAAAVAALAGLGYLGAGRTYEWASLGSHNASRNLLSPAERPAADMEFYRNMQSRQPWVQLGAGAALGSLPLLFKLSSEAASGYSASDLSLGKDFIIPAVRPLSFMHERDIPKRQSLDLINTQRPVLGAPATNTLLNGVSLAGEGSSGLISTSDIFKGLVGAGVGAASGFITSNILGTLLSQPASTKAKLANYGALGGAILNSGVFNKLF
jgi:hypothetical protein